MHSSDIAADSGVRSFLRRAARHARTPRSLPALLWGNVEFLGRRAKLAFVSRSPGYWNELGQRFAGRGRFEEALACYDHALAIRGDIAQILTNRGSALRRLDRAADAETSLREALRLKPYLANARRELGEVLNDVGRFGEAEISLRAALQLQPDNPRAHAALANILYHLGRAPEAQASYRTALRFQPENPAYHVGLGLALLSGGQLQEGWTELEWRWQSEHLIRRGWPPFPVPSWKGEPIRDRTILLIADQGLGDTLQFCRYGSSVVASSGRAILAVEPPLTRLLARLPGVGEIVPKTGGPSSVELPCPIDVWCGMMSLPHAAGTMLETIPAAIPYLTPYPVDVDQWRRRLAGLTGLRVGLCWAGGQSPSLTKIVADRRRSTTLDALAPLAGVMGVHFVSLQKGPPAAEAAYPPPGLELHDFTADLHDFADTAALVECLDLVISVDTAVVHLAGALGKPVWMLNRFDSCFRWLRDRDDSPWYPTLRQFRQPAPGDWNGAVRHAREALRRLAEGDCGQLLPSGRRG